MVTLQVRAYDKDGQFAFGATLNCRDVEAGVARFNATPLNGCRAELLLRNRVIATREAEPG